MYWLNDRTFFLLQYRLIVQPAVMKSMHTASLTVRLQNSFSTGIYVFHMIL